MFSVTYFNVNCYKTYLINANMQIGLTFTSPLYTNTCKQNKFTICKNKNINIYIILYYIINFRNIFLGETFSSYISVHNDSSQTCKEIVYKVGNNPCIMHHGTVNNNVPYLHIF